MSEADEIKEFIGYLKVVFALVLATTIGLVSWLVQNYQSAQTLLFTLMSCSSWSGLSLNLYQSENFEGHQTIEGVVEMEIVVVITVIFVIGALVYIVSEALKH